MTYVMQGNDKVRRLRILLDFIRRFFERGRLSLNGVGVAVDVCKHSV